jgi:hypothetical protein
MSTAVNSVNGKVFEVVEVSPYFSAMLGRCLMGRVKTDTGQPFVACHSGFDKKG